MLSRSLRWRVGFKWYAAALFIPVFLALAAVLLNVLLGAPRPTAVQIGAWYSLFLLLPIALVDAVLWEETGWRGYALPGFPAERSPLANTLILGVLVTAWHLPIALADRALAAPYLFAAIASAVVINWIYYNARESAFLAIVFHSVQNAIGGFYLFGMYDGPNLVRLWWLFAGVYCAVAALLLLTSKIIKSGLAAAADRAGVE